MGQFILILSYIFIICEFLWFFTCTKHENVPLILVLILLILGLIPGLSIVLAIVYIIVLISMVINYNIDLKDNWFNRIFLAYHE